MEQESLGRTIVKSGLILSMYKLKHFYMNFNSQDNNPATLERIRALEKRIAEKYFFYKEDKIIRGQYKNVCLSAQIFYKDIGKDVPKFSAYTS